MSNTGDRGQLGPRSRQSSPRPPHAAEPRPAGYGAPSGGAALTDTEPDEDVRPAALQPQRNNTSPGRVVSPRPIRPPQRFQFEDEELYVSPSPTDEKVVRLPRLTTHSHAQTTAHDHGPRVHEERNVVEDHSVQRVALITELPPAVPEHTSPRDLVALPGDELFMTPGTGDRAPGHGFLGRSLGFNQEYPQSETTSPFASPSPIRPATPEVSRSSIADPSREQTIGDVNSYPVPRTPQESPFKESSPNTSYEQAQQDESHRPLSETPQENSLGIYHLHTPQPVDSRPLPEIPQESPYKEPPLDQNPAFNPSEREGGYGSDDSSEGSGSPSDGSVDSSVLPTVRRISPGRARFSLESPSPPQLSSVPFSQHINTPERPESDGETTPRATQQPFSRPEISAPTTYATELPRRGHGFDDHPVVQPPRGSSNRPHLWVRPQPLKKEQEARIISAYIAAFLLDGSTVQPMLSQAHRFPEYTHDHAAHLRKLDFEQRTGETMSDDEYYALFDLETSADGMIPALFEWMQERTHVRVPFVNRILHQTNRLNFASAQEEARLRMRMNMDRERLKRRIEELEQACLEAKALSDPKSQREIAQAKIRGILTRADGLTRECTEFIKENHVAWTQSNRILESADESLYCWVSLRVKFMNLLDGRQELDGTIDPEDGISEQNLGEMEKLDNQIGQLCQEFHQWMAERTSNLVNRIIPWSGMSNLVGSIKEMHSHLWVEGNALNVAIDEFQCAAKSQREAVRNPREANNSGSPNTSHTDTSVSDNSGGGSVIPRRHQNQTRSQSGCNNCQHLERQLKEKEKDVNDLRDEVVEHDRQAAQARMQRDTTEKALGSVKQGDIAKALSDIDDYRELIHSEAHASLSYLSKLLKTHGGRVKVQSDLLTQSLLLIQNGGSPAVVLGDLQSMTVTVQQLIEAVTSVQLRLDQEIDAIIEHKEKRFDKTGRQPMEDLVKRLAAQIEYHEELIIKGWKSHAERDVRSIELLKRQLRGKANNIRGQLANCREELRKKQAALDSANVEHEVMAEELTRRQARCKELEDKLSETEQKLEELTATVEQSQQTVRELEAEVAELQLSGDVTLNDERWTTTNGVMVSIPETDEGPEGGRCNIRKLQDELLYATIKAGSLQLKRWEEKTKHAKKDSLPSLVKHAINRSIKGNKTGNMKAEYEATYAFWRLLEFQQKRSQVVSAIREKDWRLAAERLRLLRAWEKEQPWETGFRASEVHRTINYLQAYVGLKLGVMERLNGNLDASASQIQEATAYFNQADAAAEPGQHDSWSSLRHHLETELSNIGDEPVCDCGYKVRRCSMHLRDEAARATYHHFMMTDNENEGQNAIELTQATSEELRRTAMAMPADGPAHRSGR